MKMFFKYLLTIVFTLSIIGCGRDGEDGIDGINGINGTNGTNGNTFLSGIGVPASSLGKNGDFYLDKKTSDLYGPKSDNGWGSPISLKGGDGTNGQNGQNGTNATQILYGNTIPNNNTGNIGDWYIDLQTHKLYGPKTQENLWGEGIDLTDNIKGDYAISTDGNTLLQWFNKETSSVDMRANEELKNISIIGANAFLMGSIESIELPRNLKRIGNGAFSNNKLSTIFIPSTVTEIGKYAFDSNQLKAVNIPQGITKIEDYTFRNNQLSSISLPNSVTTIGEQAFAYNQLSSVTIPNSVKTIGQQAFAYNQLSSVTIPNSVTSIGDRAFANNRLTTVTIPNSVTTIGEQAFAQNQLTSVTIPNSVTTIGQQAFAYNQLTSVTINATTPPKIEGSNYVFGYYISKIYVPAGSVEAYKNAEGWRDYAHLITPLNY